MNRFKPRWSAKFALVILPAAFLAMPDAVALAGPQNQDEQLAEARGEAALADAREHAAAGRWRSAADAYATALRYLPGSAEAQAGLGRAQAMLDEGSTIQSTEEELQLLRDQARVEFDEDMRRARSLLGQGDYIAAERVALTAQLRLSQRRGVLPPTEFETRSRQADDLLDQVAQAREEARLEEMATINAEKDDEARRRE